MIYFCGLGIHAVSMPNTLLTSTFAIAFITKGTVRSLRSCLDVDKARLRQPSEPINGCTPLFLSWRAGFVIESPPLFSGGEVGGKALLQSPSSLYDPVRSSVFEFYCSCGGFCRKDSVGIVENPSA